MGINRDCRYSKAIINKVGFKTVKAARVIEAAKYLKNKYNCQVPRSIEELTEIKGVGNRSLSDWWKNQHSINNEYI